MMTQLALWQTTAILWLKSRFSDESGASLVEYALLLALIAVVAIGALIFLGKSTSSTLQNVANTINNG
jgi:pilus assembly protein Flp/PilA